MPSFTSQIQNLKQTGPICQVKISLSAIAIEVLTSQAKSIRPPLEVTALIDTGASATCINSDIVKGLDLVSRGITQIATPSSKAHPCNVYDAGLYFPNGVAISTLPVIEACLEGQSIQCLIGGTSCL